MEITWEKLTEKPQRPENTVSASDYGEEAICPHCEATQSDSWEYNDHEEYTCDNCQKSFIVWRETICKYITQTAEQYKALEKYNADYFKWYMQEVVAKEQAERESDVPGQL